MKRQNRRIVFPASVVRDILDGRKTQFREPMSVQPPSDEFQLARCLSTTGPRSDEGKFRWLQLSKIESTVNAGSNAYFRSPFGIVGDRLNVAEAWGVVSGAVTDGNDSDSFEIENRFAKFVVGLRYGKNIVNGYVIYRADGLIDWTGICSGGLSPSWHSAAVMPEAACRIFLEITNLRIQRLSDITEEEAVAEGFCADRVSAAMLFRRNWKDRYPQSKSHHWIWVYEFKVSHHAGD